MLYSLVDAIKAEFVIHEGIEERSMRVSAHKLFVQLGADATVLVDTAAMEFDFQALSLGLVAN